MRHIQLLLPLTAPRTVPINPRVEFGRSMELHIISWNVCGIRNATRFAALKAYAYQHHLCIVFIQEAFVGPLLGDREAPPLTGYVSYVHPIRNGLISYVHASVTHKII